LQSPSSRPWLFPSRQTPCSLPCRSHPHGCCTLSRLRQEPCCPPGPNRNPAEERFQKKCAKSTISAISALFIFCRFFVFRYRFLIFFVFVLFDGRPEGRGSTSGGLAVGIEASAPTS
jgi:hypothetical protein